MEKINTTAKNLFEFDNHKEIYRLENKDLGVIGFIAIHCRRGSYPSLGATRVWNYKDETEALKDSLRLSRLMSHKSVFADLPYGGAKATLMVSRKNFPDRKKLFVWYASELNKLGGKFITGSDVGVEETDVNLMREYSQFVIGDNVPAAYYTALGVLNSIEGVLEFLHRSPNLNEKTFAVQGLGKTGLELIKLLYPRAARIIVSDLDSEKIKQTVSMFPKVESVSLNQIYSQKVDIFCPCALNYVINSLTLPELKCSAIIGSANNQMENETIEQEAYKKGITYAVDYITNNGGLISVADQYEHGTYSDARIKEKLSVTKNKLKSVLVASKIEAISPGIIADRYVKSILNISLPENVPQTNTAQ